jgi:hypothetical protein
MPDELSLILRVEAEPNADPEALAEMGGRLRAEILELDVRSARPLTAGDAPPGARAAELAVLGGLLVSLAKSPETLKAVVGAVQGWLAGQRARSVEIEVDGDVLKVNGISSAEQQRLIDLFVERHAR